ncbi:MAG TPA: CBS domain-containing protein [Steroidobacteraceae bacterium]|nr:CBS domain-containing protein [Steroidobacteraceae bacterium]
MKVEQLMTREVNTCAPADTLERAACLLWDGDCGCLPVCADGSNRVVGMITDRDICMAAMFAGKPLSALDVAHAMSKQVAVCQADDTLETAEKVMRESRVRRLPVVDAQGALVGIVGIADLIREAAHERKIGTRYVSDSSVRDTLAAICAAGIGKRLAA